MKIKLNDPPRKFKVGMTGAVELSDCAHITLEADEQVTFVAPSGSQYDVARKSWGYYATPSLNGRLGEFGLRPALIQNTETGRFFVVLVEKDQLRDFEGYCADESLQVVVWVDQKEGLEKFLR